MPQCRWIPSFMDGNAGKDGEDVGSYAPAYYERPHCPENYAICMNTPEEANIKEKDREPDQSESCIV